MSVLSSRILKKPASVALDTREEYLVNIPQLVLLRETSDASRTTETKRTAFFEHPSGVFWHQAWPCAIGYFLVFRKISTAC
jgi:hypothetical protein